MVWKLNWCSLCCRKQQIPTEALPGSRMPWWLSSWWNRLPCKQYPQKTGNWNRNLKKNHINIKRWKSCWTWGWSCAFCQNQMYRLSWESRLWNKRDFCCFQSPAIPVDLLFLTQLFILNSSRMPEHFKRTTQTLLNWYISTNWGHSFPRLALKHINKNLGGQQTNSERKCKKKSKSKGVCSQEADEFLASLEHGNIILTQDFQTLPATHTIKILL